MNISEACAKINGSDAIEKEMGIHWAVVAAMAACKKGEDPEVIAVIDEYNRSNH